MRTLVAALVAALGTARAAAAPPASAPAASAPARAVLPVIWTAPAIPSPVAAEIRARLAAVTDRGVELLGMAVAPEPAPLAPERLRRAVMLYDDLRYDDARGSLDQAIRDAVARGAAGLSQAELSDVYLYRALCAHVRGDATRAWDDFVRAAVVAPARMLDPARFPPKARGMLQRAVATVAAAPHGGLTFVVPEGARVFVDGREAGVGPSHVVALPYGEHLVRVEHPEYVTFAGTVLLAAPEQRLDPTMRRHAPPDDLTLAEIARGRGLGHALLCAVRSERGRLRVEVRLVSAGGQRQFAERAPLSALAPALQRALGLVSAVAAPLVTTREHARPPPAPSPPPWYRRIWVWAVVGTVAASVAVAVPLATRGGDASAGLGARLDLGPVRR